MIIKQWTDVPAQEAAEGLKGVSVRWVIGEQDGAPHFAMRIFDVEPGCHTPYHSHWWEHEVYVLAGEGVAISKEAETALATGSVILVEGDEMHQFRNTGDVIFRFMCLIPWPWLEGLAAKHAG